MCLPGSVHFWDKSQNNKEGGCQNMIEIKEHKGLGPQVIVGGSSGAYIKQAPPALLEKIKKEVEAVDGIEKDRALLLIKNELKKKINRR